MPHIGPYKLVLDVLGLGVYTAIGLFIFGVVSRKNSVKIIFSLVV